jgi:hypothetical protein
MLDGTLRFLDTMRARAKTANAAQHAERFAPASSQRPLASK